MATCIVAHVLEDSLRHCVAEGEGLEDRRYGVLHPARGKFYVDNGVEEVVRSRGVHKYQ